MTKNIIWTIDAKIKNGQQEAFEKVMQDLIEAISLYTSFNLTKSILYGILTRKLLILWLIS